MKSLILLTQFSDLNQKSAISKFFATGPLVAILDLFSRKILGWQLSATLEAAPCIQLLKDIVEKYGPPNILNQDQGSQYTSNDWIALAKSHGIRLSMAGKGRCYDNINMGRFWRSLKQEEVYLTDTLP